MRQLYTNSLARVKRELNENPQCVVAHTEMQLPAVGCMQICIKIMCVPKIFVAPKSQNISNLTNIWWPNLATIVPQNEILIAAKSQNIPNHANIQPIVYNCAKKHQLQNEIFIAPKSQKIPNHVNNIQPGLLTTK